MTKPCMPIVHRTRAVQDLKTDGAHCHLQVEPPVLDGPDGRGYTPLHVACAGGHAECVVALCQAGSRTGMKNDVGLTAWDLATQLHRAEIVGLNLKDLENSAQRQRAKRFEKGTEGSSGKKKRARAKASKTTTASGPFLVPTRSFANSHDSTETEKSKSVIL